MCFWPQYLPRFARSFAVSFPIPVFAPVTIAVFPSNRISDDQLLVTSPLKIINNNKQYPSKADVRYYHYEY